LALYEEGTFCWRGKRLAVGLGGEEAKKSQEGYRKMFELSPEAWHIDKGDLRKQKR